jgi:hypothetical protein
MLSDPSVKLHIKCQLDTYNAVHVYLDGGGKREAGGRGGERGRGRGTRRGRGWERGEERGGYREGLKGGGVRVRGICGCAHSQGGGPQLPFGIPMVHKEVALTP